MNYQALFEPRTMAVVGVSLHNEQHPANVIFTKNYLRYPVKTYAVNPRGGTIQGETIYTKVSEIPDRIDLAVIVTRADTVPEVFADCVAAGVKGAIIISGGFAEGGRRDLQDRLVAIGREAGVPFAGPNCLGIYSPSFVDTFFLPSERFVKPNPGGVALVSQSGGVLVDQLIKLTEEGAGISRAISIGNKALLKEVDLMRFLEKDQRTKVIAFYVEGFGEGEGREFVRAAGECTKPVIVLKAGKSEAGIRAVSSHTASLAGDYRVFSSVLSQFGVVEARDETELIYFCESLSCYQRSIEGRIGIITSSGGHGALAVDACAALGLSVPAFPEELREGLKKGLSPTVQEVASLANPVDLTGSGVDEDFVTAVRFLSERSDVDCIITLLLPYVPGISFDLSARLSQVSQRTGKPLVAYVPHVEKYRIMIEGFELNGVPVSPSIEGAVLMADAMRRCKPC